MLNSTHKLEDVENLDQDYIIKLLNPFSVSLSGIITRLTTLLTMYPHIPKIIRLMDKTDLILQTDKSYIVQDGKYICIMVVFMILLCFPCQMLSNFGLSKNRLYVTLMFFFNSMNNFSSACAEFQFVSLSFLLYRRFKYVNKKLEGYENLGKNEQQAIFYNGKSNQQLDITFYARSKRKIKLLHNLRYQFEVPGLITVHIYLIYYSLIWDPNHFGCARQAVYHCRYISPVYCNVYGQF